jgi:hypothetical protein
MRRPKSPAPTSRLERAREKFLDAMGSPPLPPLNVPSLVEHTKCHQEQEVILAFYIKIT